MKSYKIVVLGSGGVGKSAITVQFVSGYFVERYDPTIEDFYRKVIHVGDDDIELEILDTAGTEQFASMRDLYIKNGDGFLLVYSIVNGDTFEHIQVLRQQILRMRDENVPIVIVGNKCDRKDERIVSYEDGVILSKEWHCPFRETSAKTTQNVLDVFADIAKEIGSGADSHNTCKPTCCTVQ